MKTSPIVPAHVEWQDGVPYAPEFGDVYHARAGAWAQAREVFLAGNGLPERWRGRGRFTILETGFGLGNNFLAAWAAWRADEQRPGRLYFLSVEKHPASHADLARAHADATDPDLAGALCNAWPPSTHGIHVLEFDKGRVTLLLALGDANVWMPQWQAQVDAVFLDGFAPSRNAAMWDAHLLKALGRLAAPGATAATWSAARSVRDGLAGAGFSAMLAPGFAGKRQMTVARLRDDAAGRRLGPPPGRAAREGARGAIVVGAGLAGASAAAALSRHGLGVTVLESAAAPASAGSGNPAGLFHGVVHRQDGVHAQWLRAAAIRAAQVYGPLMASRQIAGTAGGLLRGAGSATVDELRAIVDAQALPPDYVRALSQEEAEHLAGCGHSGSAWLFTGGGWLDPRALARHWLSSPGVEHRMGRAVAHLAPTTTGTWRALDSSGEVLAEADVVIVAAALGLPDLLSPHTDVHQWPLRRTRGQITLVPAAMAAGLPRPAVPLASGGYLIAVPDSLGGGLLCGASSQLDDMNPSLRADDNRANLANIEALTGVAVDVPGPEVDGHPLGGRVAWRLACEDRLPLVGAVPLPANEIHSNRPLDQVRHIPRVPGLYAFSAFGSRGITWAPLASEVLAATIVGTPLPVAGSLLDVVDPARFVTRQERQAAR